MRPHRESPPDGFAAVPEPDRPDGPRAPGVSMSDYQLVRQPPVQPEVQAPPVPVKAVELRIQAPDPAPPDPPANPPEPRMEVQAAPAKPDAPLVQALRAMREHQPDDEVRGLLKSYDPATREALLVLLGGAAQLEQTGGVAQIPPADLAAWADRLAALTAGLRPRAQLGLENTCFCRHIENFGQFRPLPPEHSTFQPGEEARVYVQVRNFASRPAAGGFTTTLKGRLEIYDESNHDRPVIVWDSKPKCDFSWTARQDYFVNFRFQVPPNCPPGSYTLWITVEDWTDAPPQAGGVPPARLARTSLDFRVGGPAERPTRTPIAEGAPAR